MDTSAMFQLSYGLYVLTARDGEKDNGCIINTVMQVTDQPLQIIIAVNKRNYTHAMMIKTELFTISVLDETAPFSVFQQFGFQSGKETDKFASAQVTRGKNGVCYLKEHCNAYIECAVKEVIDAGTHSLFLAEVTEAVTLGKQPSMTYSYYHNHIKPKPDQNAKKTGWRCKICGYIYEGENLPKDFICPLCKHSAADFERIGEEENSMDKYVCDVCGYVYDEAAGDPDNGIAPGTKWEDVPDDFLCPLCGVGKDSFSKE